MSESFRDYKKQFIQKNRKNSPKKEWIAFKISFKTNQKNIIQLSVTLVSARS